MRDVRITKEEHATGGRYVARINGIEGEGELVFTRRSAWVISADHTGVPETMGGLGVAKALLEFMLEDARRSGFRIIAVCAFVRKHAGRHPEWAELFTTAAGASE